MSCNRPATGSLSGDLSQLISKRATVTAFFATSISCGPTPEVWTAIATPQAPERFKAGKATVRAWSIACDLTCGEDSKERVVNLNAR